MLLFLHVWERVHLRIDVGLDVRRRGLDGGLQIVDGAVYSVILLDEMVAERVRTLDHLRTQHVINASMLVTICVKP